MLVEVYFKAANSLSRYLSADYEHGVFNISACSWQEDAKEDIVAINSRFIDSSGCDGDGCSPDSDELNGSSGLRRGAVAGIAVGAAVGFFLLLGILLFYIRRQRQKSKNKAMDPKPNVSVLTGPIHNGGPRDFSSQGQSSLPQSTFWSPDTLNSSSGLNNSQNNESSGETESRSNGLGGNELDGHDTQIKPVYHELHGSAVPHV